MKGLRFLEELIRLGFEGSIVAPAGLMGGDLLKTVGYPRSEVVELGKPYIGGISSREHTMEFAAEARGYGCELIVFVGGDGTARDIYLSIGSSHDTPVLGIPAGVKVYSGIFALGAESGAYLVILYRDGYARVEMRPVIDADEEDLRRGVLNIRRYGELPTIVAKNLIQGSKEPGYEYDVEGIARYIGELMERDKLYILGPGRTMYEIAKILGIEKTPFGVDAIYNGKTVGKDLDAESLEKLIEVYGKPSIILTPIGGTGFLLGRGNQQITPRVIRTAGRENIIIVMTPEKAGKTNILFIDTGDKELDQELEGYYRAIIGYREEKI
ncbi:MAG: ATP-NAD kinase family protein, partial [Sulfolobales archaeon]